MHFSADKPDAAYDSLGNRTSLTFGNGVVQASTFDPVSRLASLTNNLTGTVNDLSATFSYTPSSQIKSTSRTGNAYAFGGYVNVNRGYTSNGRNQYSAAGPATFSYDTKGNLTSDGTSTFVYSSENLLTSGPGVTLGYDPLTRLYQVAGAATTRFAYDGLNMIAEHNGSNALQRRHVFAPGLDRPIATYDGAAVSSATRRFLSADERGSIISVTDNAGAVIAINRYDEYGIPGSGNSGRFGYTGQEWLPELGMNYYKARVYSPTLGRFLQTDPIGQADNPNLYAYAGNTPITAIDPLGLCNDPDGNYFPPPPGTRLCPSNSSSSSSSSGSSGYNSGGSYSGGGPVDGVPLGSCSNCAGLESPFVNASIVYWGGYYFNGVWNSLNYITTDLSQFFSRVNKNGFFLCAGGSYYLAAGACFGDADIYGYAGLSYPIGGDFLAGYSPEGAKAYLNGLSVNASRYVGVGQSYNSDGSVAATAYTIGWGASVTYGVSASESLSFAANVVSNEVKGFNSFVASGFYNWFGRPGSPPFDPEF